MPTSLPIIYARPRRRLVLVDRPVHVCTSSWADSRAESTVSLPVAMERRTSSGRLSSGVLVRRVGAPGAIRNPRSDGRRMMGGPMHALSSNPLNSSGLPTYVCLSSCGKNWSQCFTWPLEVYQLYCSSAEALCTEVYSLFLHQPSEGQGHIQTFWTCKSGRIFQRWEPKARMLCNDSSCSRRFSTLPFRYLECEFLEVLSEMIC